MKRSSLTMLALGASLLTAGLAFGQNKAAPAASAPAATAPAEKPQKLLKIATLSTAEANQEFQRNVQLLQAQRQAAVELNTQWLKETDAKKKAELKTQLDQQLAKLNENDQKMQKFYGFSLTRNYTMEIVTSNIYMVVTDEEAAKIEKEQSAKAPAVKEPSTKK